MKTEQIHSILDHIECALELVRDQMANGAEDDCLLRQNEVTLECLQKDWRRRVNNAMQINQRIAS